MSFHAGKQAILRHLSRTLTRTALASSTSASCILLASTALAATQTHGQTKHPAAVHRTASHRSATPRPQSHAPLTAAAGTPEAVQVSGHRRGSHSAEQVVTRATMDHFVAGSSPLQVLGQTTPGVSFASSDTFGLDTVANTLYIRGFTQSQIGATLDGIPLGDQGFHNWNGLNIAQAAIQDDLSSMTVSQGAGSVDTASAQNLGGAIHFFTADPADKAGGKISQSFGSNDTFRTFAKADSGILNPTGTKFYAAFARTKQDLWKGYGYQQELQADAKLVQPINTRGKITAMFNYSNFSQYNYLSLTKNMWQTLGRDTTYLKPNYALATQYALMQNAGTLPANLQGKISQDEFDNFAYDGTQVQRNYMSSIRGDYDITNTITSHTTAYGHVMSGDYGGTYSGLISPDTGAPNTLAIGHASTRRLGFLQTLDVKLHKNDIETGIWYQNNFFQYPMRLYQDGTNYAHNSIGDFKASQATTWYVDNLNTNTFQFFIQDTYHILPHLNLTAGFRSLTETTHGGTSFQIPDSAYPGSASMTRGPTSGSLTASNAFLPHFNLDYNFLSHHEIYIDIAENMRTYTQAAQGGSGSAWSGVTQASFNASKPSLKPERTWNYVVGYRYNSAFFTGSADFYHTDFYNRLLSTQTGTINNTTASFINAGRETMNGADVLGTIRPVPGLEITNSFSWNDATYENSHLPDGNGGYISIKGKHQIAYPKFMYKADASYTYKKATVSFNVVYTSARPITYSNDVKVPAYWTGNLLATYDFGRLGFTQNLKATFGITNLFNGDYIGGIYNGSAQISGDGNAELFVAAPRQYMGTVSAAF